MDGCMARSTIIGAALVTLAASTYPMAARAWFATEWTQLGQVITDGFNWAENVQTQINTYRAYEDMVRNFNPYGHLADTVPQVKQAMGLVRQFQQTGAAISYSRQNVIEDVRAKFKDFDAFVAANYGKRDFVNDYKEWQKSTQDSIAGALKAAGVSEDSMDDEEATMRSLLAKSDDGEGRNKLMQVGNEISAAMNGSLQKMRQLQATEIQVLSSYFNRENAKDSAAEAGIERWVNPDLAGPNRPVADDERGELFTFRK